MHASRPPTWGSAIAPPPSCHVPLTTAGPPIHALAESQGTRLSQAMPPRVDCQEAPVHPSPVPSKLLRNPDWTVRSPLSHPCSKFTIRRVSSGGSLSSAEMDAARAPSPDTAAQPSKQTMSPPQGNGKRARSAVEVTIEDELVRRAHACADLDFDNMRNKRFLSEAMAKDLDRLNMAREEAPGGDPKAAADGGSGSGGTPHHQHQDERMGAQDGPLRGSSPPHRRPHGHAGEGPSCSSGSAGGPHHPGSGSSGPFDSPVAQTNPFWGSSRSRGSNFMVMRRQSSPPTPSTGSSTPAGAMTPSSATPIGPPGGFFPLPPQSHFPQQGSGAGGIPAGAPMGPPASGFPSYGSSDATAGPQADGAGTGGSEPPETPSHLMTTSALHQRILAQHDAMTPAARGSGGGGRFGGSTHSTQQHQQQHYGAPPAPRNPSDTPLPATPIKSKHLLMEKLPGGPGPTSPSDPQLSNHDLRRTAMLRALLQRAEISDGTPGARGPAPPAGATTPPVLSLLGPTPRRPGGAMEASSSLLAASPPYGAGPGGFSAPLQDHSDPGSGGGQSLAMRMDAAAEEEEAERLRRQGSTGGADADSAGPTRGPEGGVHRMSDSSMELSPTTSAVSDPDMDSSGVPGAEPTVHSRRSSPSFHQQQQGQFSDTAMWTKA